ncbi:hypothetical protein C6P45_001270 [Maudiozyma exigua]|uniref:PA14 domain-containing protein n=1 Tax=Maudiozyma exigua TaxID=34358 RepID=A0A9P6W3Q6_MAUEX|nr:hypothetical protein C6P45_001270 [Kazachstania exigua]
MLFTLLVSVFLFNRIWTNFAFADSCANFVVNSYWDNGFGMVTYGIPFNSSIDEIADVLYNSTVNFNTEGTPIYYYLYDISIDIKVTDTSKPFIASLYPGTGMGVDSVSNIALVYQGFFVAPEAGDYTFTIDDVGVNAGASIYIYNNRDMYCCNDMDNYAWLSKTSQVTYIPSDSRYQTQSVTVNLEAGVGYLIEYAYTNFAGDVVFKTSVTFPSGETTTNFTNYIYTLFNDFYCDVVNDTSSVIALGTETYTTTYSTTEITNIYTGEILGAPYTSIDTIYYIMTPAAVSSSSEIPSSSDIATSSSTLPAVSSSSIITSSDSISSSGARTSDTSLISSSSSMTSSVLLSSVSNLLPSSVISSSVMSSLSSRLHSTNSSYNGITSKSSSSASTDSKSSIIRTSATSDSVQSTRSEMSVIHSKNISYSSTSIPFSNSSIVSGSMSEEGSTSLTVSVSSTESSGTNSKEHSSNLRASAAPESQSYKSSKGQEENSRSTSTYTDQYGETKIIIIDCSTKSNIKSTQPTSSDNGYISNIDSNGNIVASTVSSNHNEATDVTGILATAQDSLSSSKNNLGHSTEATVTVYQQIFDGSSSSASIHIQQTPNIAGRSVTSFVLSMSLLIEFFIL